MIVENESFEDITQLSDKLFICNWNTSRNINFIEKIKPNYIVCISEHEKDEETLNSYRELNIKHIHIKLYDNGSEKIRKLFSYAKLISEILKNETVLVHCMSGISRSPMFIMLIWYFDNEKINIELYDKLLNFFKLKRKISINEGFSKQLEEIYKKSKL